MESLISKLSHGIVKEKENFMLVGLVKDGASGAFNDAINVDSENKCYILCSCQLKNFPHDTILYFSNDPNDFINNTVASASNNGIVPMKINKDQLEIDLINKYDARTLPLPSTTKFDYNIKKKTNNFKFTSRIKNINFPLNRLQHGIPYKITDNNNERINFYVRKNLINGRIGSSLAYFSTPSTAFEYLKTNFYAARGSSLQYSFDKNKLNMLGVSNLILETNSDNFSSLPAESNCGIISLKQGTSFWYNIFSNPQGVSDVFFNFNEGKKFLNKEVFEPDTSQGLSIQVNIRNDDINFTSIQSFNLPSTTEVFDFYLVNLTGFLSSGVENNSRQYHDENSNIIGGICYHPDEKYTYYNYFRSEHLKGFLHNLNSLNKTQIDVVKATDKKTSLHAEPYSVFSNHYESLYGIDLNSFNSYESRAKPGRERVITSFVADPTTLTQNSSKNLLDPNKPIFTNNKQKYEERFYVQIIIMSLLLVAYIIFAYFYSTIDLK